MAKIFDSMVKLSTLGLFYIPGGSPQYWIFDRDVERGSGITRPMTSVLWHFHGAFS